MSQSGVQLQQAADAQIAELIDLLSTRDPSALKLQCRGRERLGDGTVAASAMHTADNYHRIADFLRPYGFESDALTAGPCSHMTGV